jgi:hypothetical protein
MSFVGDFFGLMDLIGDENFNVGAGGKQLSLPLAITLQHCVCHWSSLHQPSAPCMWKALNILNQCHVHDYYVKLELTLHPSH